MGVDVNSVLERLCALNDVYASTYPYNAFLPNDVQSNDRLRDIENEPHLFVIACFMNRQMPVEKVWNIPFELEKRLGSISFSAIAAYNDEHVCNAMQHPKPLHRFHRQQALYLCENARRVNTQYCGDVRRIWSDEPSSYVLVSRIFAFHGVGQKIATMFANIIVRDLCVKVKDKRAIDVSLDTHAKRVLKRLGLVSSEDNDAITLTIRGLYPEYPGVLDLPLWVIGYEYCHAQRPQCRTDASCPMHALCPKRL